MTLLSCLNLFKIFQWTYFGKILITNFSFVYSLILIMLSLQVKLFYNIPIFLYVYFDKFVQR